MRLLLPRLSIRWILLLGPPFILPLAVKRHNVKVDFAIYALRVDELKDVVGSIFVEIQTLTDKFTSTTVFFNP